jgi:hypothetical protein
MANGVRCKNCGYQETEHGHVSLKYIGIDENVLLPNYKMSLNECMSIAFTGEGGYDPEDPIEHEKGGSVDWNHESSKNYD